MSTTATTTPSRSILLAVALLFTSSGPLVAQELGGQAYRTSIGATLLLPGGDVGVGDMNMVSAPGRLPSGRAVLEIQANPVFGFHLGAMRLAPNVMWADSTDFFESEDPRLQMGLTAGIAGFRLNFLTGRFRLAPFVDAGVGRADARIDRGGAFYLDGATETYYPAQVDTASLMAGGGGGVVTDVILGPGLTLSALGGYWHFMSLESDEEGEPIIDPLSGLFAGAGVKLAFRDATYYWRHSGKDQDPPVIAILSPKPTDDGVVDVGEDFTTLSLRLADRSNIDSVYVAGKKLRLVQNRSEPDKSVRSVLTSAELELNPGPNRISYTAFDGAGNRLEGEWEVLGIPLDKDGPRIAVLQPTEDLSISTENIMVEAIIVDRSPINQVTLNGLTVRAVEATAEERRRVEAGPADFVVKFSSTSNVPTASFDIAVAAVDSASNTQVRTVTVKRADLAVAAAPAPTQQPAPAQRQGARGPEIEIHTPAEWAGGGTRGFAAQPKASIRVTGLARYSDGVKEVFANNKRMALQRDPNNAGIVQFSGFVEPPAPGSNGEVEILVRGADGSQSVQTYAARTAEAVTTGAAQFADIADASRRQRWAVIIGVSDYTDETIGDLQYADDDAQAVYDFLRSPSAGMGGIPESNIQLLVNEQATSRNIRSALTTFLRSSTPDDVVFLYIAAHGAPDPYRPDDLYILTHDTEIADIAATAISMADVNKSIQDAYAYNKVLVTDACHSAGVGSGTRALNNNQINAAFLDYMNSSSGGFVAFTASEANQLSQEGQQYGGGHGVFTHFFLEGLNGAADDDGDQVVTLGEVMEFTRDRVRRETRNAQIPTISLTTYDRFWPMAAVMSDEGEGIEQ